MSACRPRLWAFLCGGLTAALLSALSASPAHADVPGTLDLDVHRLAPSAVPTLHMRAAGEVASRAAQGATANVAASATPEAPKAMASDRQDSSGSSLGRAVQEAVVFRFNLGYELDSAGLSGARGLSSLAPGETTAETGDAFRSMRQYGLGDLVLGTDGWLVPSMSTYFASKLHFGIDGASAFSPLANQFDLRDGRALLVRAAYAEIDGLGQKGGQLDRIYLRAGRQFRYGSTRFIANFDGLTAAYDAPGFEVSGFVGQRVLLYVSGHRGLIGGAGFKIRGQELFDIPVALAVDYLFLDGGNSDNTGTGSSRSYLETLAQVKFGQADLSLSARLADNGALVDSPDASGFGLARIGLGYRQPLGKRMLLTADIAHLTDREVAYDMTTPASVDIVQTASQLGLGIDSPGDATRAGLRLNMRLWRKLEVYAFANGNFVHGRQKSGFNTSFQEVGAALYARLLRRIHLTGQYKFRGHQLNDSANLAGSEFDDLSGSGVSTMHELSAEARYRAPAIRTSLALSGYQRIYQLRSPYAEIAGDARLGVRLQANVKMTRQVRFNVSGEVAQASPVLAVDLGTLMSVRAFLEAAF